MPLHIFSFTSSALMLAVCDISVKQNLEINGRKLTVGQMLVYTTWQ